MSPRMAHRRPSPLRQFARWAGEGAVFVFALLGLLFFLLVIS